jgi:hypothetical protein
VKIKDITGEYLFEMPEMIGNEDFGLDSDTINTEMAKSILNDKETIKVGEINNLPLYKTGNKYTIIVMEKKKPTIKYLVKYEVNHIDMLGIDAAQQVSLWRDTGSEYNNIASKMFFDYILPVTGSIVTDLFQTEYGQRFWDSRVKDAFKMGLGVYYVNTETKTNTKLKTYQQLKQLKDEIWGDGNQYQTRRVLISK